ncbi:hypothetical protein BS333_03440 [Vibrio azureus]|uniref:Uncharacterized protein n=1 Tax=Vibrio azureus NBRC 104587 TaxID=1219077 RepID=U3AXU5_9VIBR|nr:hypothetical protein [Vibrio azureus]AUI85511.1 hypothetical protein BS333_03440 [Vibrio azureus]GAD78052.1 hypothetical protein VAZ01S_116_00030 [Vibrio azureus NBRC 104587]
MDSIIGLFLLLVADVVNSIGLFGSIVFIALAPIYVYIFLIYNEVIVFKEKLSKIILLIVVVLSLVGISIFWAVAAVLGMWG